MKKLMKFFRLKFGRKLMLLESAFFLAVSRIAVLTVKFDRIAPRLGEHGKESTEEIAQPYLPVINEVKWAVNAMSAHTFWESKCLVQAIAAKKMLKRRKIKSTLYLGVAKDSDGKMIAHAWVKSGGIILTGARGFRRFTVVSFFGD